jgi:phospholipid/cholesterol/gamma-HCH transport system substrate-binding protein
MAGKTSKFMVGLFVSLGLILGVSAIIWIGATKYFEKGKYYVTYFDESVQGLQLDSNVKYRGVEVGRVMQIAVAPDNRLISVVMKINLKDNLPKNALSQLKTAGITGLVFVELDRRKADEPDQSPKLTFPAEYPVIPSRPSEIAKILAGVNEVVTKFNQMDTRGIFDQLKSTAAEIEIFFKGPKMDTILSNIEITSANLKNISGRMDKLTSKETLDQILTEARDALKGTRLLMASLETELKGMNLRDTMGKMQSITTEVRSTSENLRQASETLDSFMGRIKDRPSDLLFGKPPKKRFNE